jgi:hypothetical protein
LRYPQLEHACELVACPIDPRSPEFQRAQFLFDSRKARIVYICLTEDARSLSAALALLPQARKHHIQIVVRLTTDAGLATLLEGEDGAGDSDYLKAFGLLNRMCRRYLVLGGTNEIIARAIYEDRALNHPSHPACDWEALPESAKESYRHQADGRAGDGLERATTGIFRRGNR